MEEEHVLPKPSSYSFMEKDVKLSPPPPPHHPKTVCAFPSGWGSCFIYTPPTFAMIMIFQIKESKHYLWKGRMKRNFYVSESAITTLGSLFAFRTLGTLSQQITGLFGNHFRISLVMDIKEKIWKYLDHINQVGGSAFLLMQNKSFWKPD